MRLTTILAFVVGYAIAHYGLHDGRWASLSPQAQRFVATFGVVLVLAILVDKLYVGPKVARHE